jgi:hypothetical protein
MPIDRSIPLPIHDPAKTMIQKVAELKKLAESEHPGDYKSSNPDWQYECQVLNAAPAMLDVLGEIRAGDAEKLQVMADWFKQMPLLDEQWVRELLNRYQAMASEMAEERDAE